MEEDGMQALGFMFDSEHEKTFLECHFQDNYVVRIKTIGENPGHKQSGQYVWPAAKGLAEYLLDHRNDTVISQAAKIVELGSGCGIGGIIAAKALPNCSKLIMTDYDPGALSLINDNISLNGVADNCSTLFLEWGDVESLKQNQLFGDIDLIIGADLIYSKDVVFPLFKTVQTSLRQKSNLSYFLLVTSFALGEGIEETIESSCRELSLRRECVLEGNTSEHSDSHDGDRSKLQYYGCRVEKYYLL